MRDNKQWREILSHILQVINSSKVSLFHMLPCSLPSFARAGGRCVWDPTVHFSQFHQFDGGVSVLSSDFDTSS